MLYSKEFYAILRPRLRPDGILEQWLPEGDSVVRTAVARALFESFPYVRVFQYSPTWGFQFLASSRPIPVRTVSELVERMPESAVRDIMEWQFAPTAQQEFNYVLEKETSMSSLLSADPNAQAMQDDHPVNEYVILRKLNEGKFKTDSLVAWYEHTKND
jgi:hypothetical protein